MQFGQQPLEFGRLRLPVGLALRPHRLAAGRPSFRNHVFHIPVFGHELKNVLPGHLSEFGTQVDIVPEIIDPRDQAFQNERRFIAGQNKLTGVFRQTTALKERKRHFGRLIEGMLELYPSSPASLTLLSAPSMQAMALLLQPDSYCLVFLAFSNSSPCCQPANSGWLATSQPSTSPNFASFASAVKSMSARYSSEGWW